MPMTDSSTARISLALAIHNHQPVGNFGWVLVLGALMAIEKNLPWGRRLSAPLGFVLLAWGVSLLIGVFPASRGLLA